MLQTLKVAWNRLKNHLESSQNRFKVARISKKAQDGAFWLSYGRLWVAGPVLNNNNTRLDEQLNNVKDFGEHSLNVGPQS